MPNAGALERQLEQSLPGFNLPKVGPGAAPVVEPLPSEGLTVTVSDFEIRGNTLVPTEVLLAALQAYKNRPLSFAELQEACNLLVQTYDQAGWLAYAGLPRQEINHGVVIIQVQEARWGGVQQGGDLGPHFVSMAQLEAMALAAQKDHLPFFNTRASERAVLLMQDLPGGSVTNSLAPGRHDGETDLVLMLQDDDPVSFSASTDNMGSVSTGPFQETYNLTWQSPSGTGDALRAMVLNAQGSKFGSLEYSWPWGDEGLRANAHLSDMHYNLVAPSFAALDGLGGSDAVGGGLAYPVVRSQTANLYVRMNYDFHEYTNRAQQALTSQYRLNALTGGFNGNLFDEVGGGGANSAGLNFVLGDVNLNGSPNQSADAQAANTQGRYAKWSANLSRQQNLFEDLTFYSALRAQMGSKNLDSSEKIYLGGPAGVRAYPNGEGGGTQGMVLNLELRQRLVDRLVLTGFYDAGHSHLYKFDSTAAGSPISTMNNNVWLRGGGAQLEWMGPLGTNFKMTWARRIGLNPNPNPTASRADQDGTLIVNRFWFSGGLAF